MTQKARKKMLQRMLWLLLTVKEFVMAEMTREYLPPVHPKQGIHHNKTHP
jgi:hypothetical protein